LNLKKFRKIAKGINYLHSKGIIHGHITSKNILVTDNMEPLITDYAFFNLKKLANVFLKYRNKNAYSAPEILKENKDVNLFCTDYAIDSYSYGILLWEIYRSTQPFNVSMYAVYKIVVEDDLRPEISKNFHSGFANLIKSCWDKNKEKRPDFNKILNTLEQI